MTAPDLRDVLIVAHPAGTVLVDVTERNERGIERVVQEAKDWLREAGVHLGTPANIAAVAIPRATLETMLDGSTLRVLLL